MGVFDKWKGRSLTGFDAQKIKRHFLPYSVLVAALFAMTFFGVCVPDFGPRGPKGPAAYIQDEFISFREFRWVYQGLLDSTRQRMGDDFDTQNNSVAQQALSQLVSAQVSYYLATELGLSVSEQGLVEYIKEQSYFHNEQGKFDNDQVARAIEYWGITADIYKQGVRRDLILAKLQDLISKAYFRPSALDEWRAVAGAGKMSIEYLVIDPKDQNIEVSADELASYLEDPQVKDELKEEYQRNIYLYQRQGGRKARQILIAYAGARQALDVSRSKDQAMELALEVRAQLMAGPDEFLTLVEQYSDDKVTKGSGGEMGLLTREDVVPEISEVLFAMKPGQWSSVVSSPFGFHIIQLTEIQDQVDISFEEVVDSLARARLLNRKFTDEAKQITDQVLMALLPKSAQVLSSADSASDDFDQMDQTDDGASFDELKVKYNLSWKPVNNIDFLTASMPEPVDIKGLKLALLSKMGEQSDIHQMKGMVLDQAFASANKQYIVRIKDVTLSTADQDSRDKAKMISSLESLYKNMARLDAYYRFQSLVRYYQLQWESEKKIRINQDYLELDRSNS